MSRMRTAEVCRLLRSKGMYLPREDADLEVEVSSTAVFWCLRSMSVIGPDDGPVAPEDCRRGRSCHEARGGKAGHAHA